MTPQATLETLLHSSHHWFDERVKRAIAVAFFEATKDWGVDLYSDEPGDFNISLSPVLALRHADTKSLQCELDALFQRYNTLNAEGQHPYLVRLTLVPGTRR